MINQAIYTVGGTVQAGGGIYIKRRADDELLKLCRAGELAFILSSRQVGKSSLMIRTAQQLEKENIRSSTTDLSAIGVNVTKDEWYLGILNEIATSMDLKADLFAWWAEYAKLGPAQLFFAFLRDVLLKEIKENVVLFFDEIDSTLSIPFADDFFATLRAVYNARSTTPEFKRLSFVLVGVATPSDLISDSKRTPFNIGHRVDLNDFTLQEAMPLGQGLGEEAKQVLAWTLDWSGGHPYLTQRLCAELSKNHGRIEEETVAQVVEQLFLGDQGRHDNNLQFVRDLLVKRSPDVRRVMNTYMDVRTGNQVADDERSIVKAHLKISGVVKRQEGNLVTRNRIYEHVFDPKWIQENTPSAIPQRVMVASALVLVFGLLIAAYLVYQERTRTDAERADRFTSGFQTAKDPQTRLRNLAGVFELDGYAEDARILFNQLSQDEKMQLFAADLPSSARENQAIVVEGLYRSMANSESDNALLRAMKDSIKDTHPSRAFEVSTWLKGREQLNQKTYQSAVQTLSYVIEELNDGNSALYYDRAQAYIGCGSEDCFSAALNDLMKMIELDQNRRMDAYLLIQSDPSFRDYWITNQGAKEYEELASIIPTATITPAPTQTSTPTRTPIPTPTLTPEPTLSSTPTNQLFSRLGLCVVSEFSIHINVRSGPGTIYAPLGEPLLVDTCLFFSARNEEETWLQVASNQPDPTLQQYQGGWIHRELLGLGTTGPIALPAVTLTPTSSPTPFTPEKPDQFLTFFFNTLIYERNYNLAWSLLTEDFKQENNPDPNGFENWKDFWAQVNDWSHSDSTVVFRKSLKGETQAIVSAKWVFGALNPSRLSYCLIRNERRNTWMIDILRNCSE